MSMSSQDATLLLPFLANGTLEGDELTQVLAAVDQDPALATELAALKNMRATMRAEDAGFSPGELGLARLMRDVETQTPQVAAPRSHIWQIAAAVLMAVTLGQTFLLTQTGEGEQGFELAGDTPAAFTVPIAPPTTAADLRALLLAAGVEIISGPSALGLYGLALLEGVDQDTARTQLQSATDIIETFQ
jgi:anti-sigma factor RsiW